MPRRGTKASSPRADSNPTVFLANRVRVLLIRPPVRRQEGKKAPSERWEKKQATQDGTKMARTVSCVRSSRERAFVAASRDEYAIDTSGR